MARFENITGPVTYASYFVNGDASGLEPHEKEQADRWLKVQGVHTVQGIIEDSERFTWAFEMYSGILGILGGQVCDYVCHMETETAEQD